VKDCMESSFNNDLIDNYLISNNLDDKILKAIFKAAYLAGRDDGLNGIFVDHRYAYENFLSINVK